MIHDYHAHTTYSDGSGMAAMAAAAEAAGLDGIGFADHCNVSGEPPGSTLPHDLDVTFPHRRRRIERLRDRFDIRLFDAVEMDYRPADEDRIRSFLARADFDYTLGSIHHVDGHEVMAPGSFVETSEEWRRRFIDRYFDRLCALVEADLFDVVAHIDVFERNEHLRGRATGDHYRDVADTLEVSDAVVELNAGRVFDEYGRIHPRLEFLEILAERSIPFVRGTDSHRPADIGDRFAFLERIVDDRGIEPVTII